MLTIPNNRSIIYLDRNENQFGPAPECYSVLRSATKNELSNYSRDFMRSVKSTLSETLAREYDLPEPGVLLSYGSEDMLKQIVHCYLAGNGTMIVPKYSWWYYKSVAGEVGGKVVDYPMYGNETSFYYEMDEIISLVRSVKPRIVLLASPNNPTGNSISPNDIKLLLQKCSDTMIVVDEAYFGFTDLPDDDHAAAHTSTPKSRGAENILETLRARRRAYWPCVRGKEVSETDHLQHSVFRI